MIRSTRFTCISHTLPNNTAKKTKPEPKTKKNIFKLSSKELKMVHGGKGVLRG